MAVDPEAIIGHIAFPAPLELSAAQYATIIQEFGVYFSKSESKSNQIKSNQIKIKSNQIKSNQIKNFTLTRINNSSPVTSRTTLSASSKGGAIIISIASSSNI